MRAIEELIDDREPAWPIIQQWISEAAVDVEVLPTNRERGEAALYSTQVTTRSPMGAIICHSAGILVDSGWLRILAAGGHERFKRSLPAWNEGRSNGYLLVADDAVGGSFAINGGALGDDRGLIYYFAPDALRWEACGLTYSQFVLWALTSKLTDFYQSLRWQGWQSEVLAITGDQALNFYPPHWTKGPALNERSRRAVPVAEQYSLQLDFQRQLDGR